MRIGVVGAGIVGLCTAWALARRGHAVTVFEAGPIPNPIASSHDEHRIIRHAYGSMIDYALMMPQAFAAWERLWADLGMRHIVTVPATYCLRMELDWYRPVSESLDAMGIAYRDIPLDEVPRSLPMVNPQGLRRVVETEGAGMLLASRILAHLARYLPHLGVELRPDTRVAHVDPERARIGEWAGDAVVIAAGAWLPRLLGAAAGSFRTTVQTVVYVDPPPSMRAAWATAPMLLNRLPVASGGVYVLPPREGTRLKLGDYDHNDDGDPDAPRIATPVQRDRVLDAAALAIAQFEAYRVVEVKPCFYTVAPDDRFVVRPLGKAGWMASACSGHGFKFGAMTGEALADGVTGARPAQEVEDAMAGRLSQRRPTDGRPITGPAGAPSGGTASTAPGTPRSTARTR